MLAQECELASALVVALGAPGVDVDAKGVDGSWTTSSGAPGFFQANALHRRTATALEPPTGDLRRVEPGNNLRPSARHGVAFATYEHLTPVGDAYAWHEVQVFVDYGITAGGLPQLSVSSKVTDLACRRRGHETVIQEDCTTGTVTWTVPRDESGATVTFEGTRVRVVQACEVRTIGVKPGVEGTSVLDTSRRAWGTWAYDGVVAPSGSRGLERWSSTARPNPVVRSITSKRGPRSWSAAGSRA